MRRRLGIIILNYKTPDLAIDCLHSLKEQIEPGIAVVVVDNASNDGSSKRIEEQITSNEWESWARVLCSSVNGGFAAGNNLGIQAIDADAYILLNADTIVLPNTTKELLHAMELRPDAGLIGPRCVSPDGNKALSTFQFIRPITDFIRSASTGPVSRLLRRYDVPFHTTDVAAEPDWVGFGCVLIRREVIEQVGLLDDGFFMYFEDVDYCHRVRNAGWTIMYWPKGGIVHLLGGSSGFTSEEALQNRAPRYFYESRARYFAKHYGRIGLLLANVAWLLGRCISLSRELLGNKQPHHRKNEACDIWINVLNPVRTSPIPTEGRTDQ